MTSLVETKTTGVSPTSQVGIALVSDNATLNSQQKGSASMELPDNLPDGYEHYLDDDDGTFKLRKKQVDEETEIIVDTVIGGGQDTANEKLSPNLRNEKTKSSPSNSDSPPKNAKPRLQRQSKDNHMLKTYLLGSGFRKGTSEEKLQPEIINMLSDDRSSENKDRKTVQLIAASALGCLGIEQSQANKSNSPTTESTKDASLELTPTRRRKQDLKNSTKDDSAVVIVGDEEVSMPKASASKRRARKKQSSTSVTGETAAVKGDVNANSLKNQPAPVVKKVAIVKCESASESSSKTNDKSSVSSTVNESKDDKNAANDASFIKISPKPPPTSPATVRKWMFVNLTQPSTGKQVTKKVMLAMNPSTAARWDVVKSQVIKELFPNYVPTVKVAEKKKEDNDVIVLSDSDDDSAGTSKCVDSKSATPKTKARRRTISQSEKVEMVSVLQRTEDQQSTGDKGSAEVASPPKSDAIEKPVAEKPMPVKANISVVSLKKPNDVSQLQLLLTNKNAAAKSNNSGSSNNNKRKAGASDDSKSSKQKKKNNSKADDSYDDDVMQALRDSKFSFAKKLLSKDKSKKSDGSNSKTKVEGPSVRIKGSLANPISCEIVNVGKSEGGGSSGSSSKRPKQESSKSSSSASVSVESHTMPWLCSLCHQADNANGLGDLFGPYMLEQKHLDEKDAILRGGGDGAAWASSSQSHGLLSPSRKRSLLSPHKTPVTEVWVHEECLVWSNGVFFGADRLHGLDEMFAAASAAVCFWL